MPNNQGTFRVLPYTLPYTKPVPSDSDRAEVAERSRFENDREHYRKRRESYVRSYSLEIADRRIEEALEVPREKLAKYPKFHHSSPHLDIARYDHCFEYLHKVDVHDQIPDSDVPKSILSSVGWIPWIIEAPLNSVEVLEALLKPSKPFEIYTARHIARPRIARAEHDRRRVIYDRLYVEYKRYQGRLEEERDVRFICVPTPTFKELRAKLRLIWVPMRLHYISIKWGGGDLPKTVAQPWALFLQDTCTARTYEAELSRLLKQCNLLDCKFERSLLRPGTTPLPETLWDLFGGYPGTSGALPYYVKEEDDAEQRGVELQEATEAGGVDDIEVDDANRLTLVHRPKL